MLRRTCRALTALLALALPAAAVPVPRAVFLGLYQWHVGTPAFGGFSGLDLSANGGRFLVLSDRAHVAQGQFLRDAEGRITTVRLGRLYHLRDARGRQLSGDEGDSEGLAAAPGGGFYVSFERDHRVVRYPRIAGLGQTLPRPAAFRRFARNRSLEALAIDGQGALWTTPERIPAHHQPLKLYRYADGRWSQPAGLPNPGGFLPVGADFGPDGRLYLLERDYMLVGGFRTRVRRFAPVKGGFDKGETVLQTYYGQFDNLEGLSVWRDGRGRIRLTMISDDNFSSLQQTEFVEYALPD